MGDSNGERLRRAISMANVGDGCEVWQLGEHLETIANNYDNDFIQLENENAALRERLAKLESLGPWIEANRLAEQGWADETCSGQGIIHRGRADAFKQVGDELNNRAGKDLRKEP